MSFPHETQVLVVGAGPVGLAAAITLTQLGINVTIVEASSATHKGARASVVHARTLEVLKTVNIAKPLIDKGTPVDHFTIRGSTEELLHVDFNLLKKDTQFPFALLISQELVEKIFVNELNNLGGKVHLNKKAINIQPINDSDKVEVFFEDGTRIITSYIIGADGIHSLVRKTAGISFNDPFTGKPYDDPNATDAFVVILSDLYLKEPYPEQISHKAFTVHADHFFFLLPLQSVDDKDGLFWRVGIGFPPNTELPKYPTQEDVQKLINERNPWPTPMVVSSIISASRYRVRAAQANTYYSKIGNTNVLLAGDAAHIHSPAGGQGMNLGICDAVAAAEAIHAHIHSSSPKEERDGIFAGYSTRRHIVGRRVIEMTKVLSLIANSGRLHGWKRLLRNAIFFVVNRVEFAKRAFVWRMSGLINRDQSSDIKQKKMWAKYYDDTVTIRLHKYPRGQMEPSFTHRGRMLNTFSFDN
ncbi:hypothetical protein Clacol_006008 [Clathrus columnatus]|uniref:FAD-binding domain-containing protein n=1 Tax=Clathrus columnatus TaxID=1419009 RepID=A0AAV5AIK1_9AGAM|nr:hypothetical protein Clacol_006008 [Clathrus columnatus]